MPAARNPRRSRSTSSCWPPRCLWTGDASAPAATDYPIGGRASPRAPSASADQPGVGQCWALSSRKEAARPEPQRTTTNVGVRGTVVRGAVVRQRFSGYGRRNSRAPRPGSSAVARRRSRRRTWWRIRSRRWTAACPIRAPRSSRRAVEPGEHYSKLIRLLRSGFARRLHDGEFGADDLAWMAPQITIADPGSSLLA